MKASVARYLVYNGLPSHLDSCEAAVGMQIRACRAVDPGQMAAMHEEAGWALKRIGDLRRVVTNITTPHLAPPHPRPAPLADAKRAANALRRQSDDAKRSGQTLADLASMQRTVRQAPPGSVREPPPPFYGPTDMLIERIIRLANERNTVITSEDVCRDLLVAHPGDTAAQVWARRDRDRGEHTAAERDIEEASNLFFEVHSHVTELLTAMDRMERHARPARRVEYGHGPLAPSADTPGGLYLAATQLDHIDEARAYLRGVLADDVLRRQHGHSEEDWPQVVRNHLLYRASGNGFGRQAIWRAALDELCPLRAGPTVRSDRAAGPAALDTQSRL